MIDLSQVEERIRPHVRWLRDNGVKTVSSCGHDMYVMVDWPLDDLARLGKLLRAQYADDFEIVLSPHAGSGGTYWIKIRFSGPLEGDGKPEDLVLLKVEPDSLPLYFVLRQRHFDHIHDSNNSREDDRNADSYFYDEGTCPTNWTGDIEAVISDGDADPHGFATFVRRLPAPDGPQHDLDWQALFPEAFPDG